MVPHAAPQRRHWNDVDPVWTDSNSSRTRRRRAVVYAKTDRTIQDEIFWDVVVVHPHAAPLHCGIVRETDLAFRTLSLAT